VNYTPEGRQLISFDLASGEKRTLFAAPPNSWLQEATISPDGEQIVLSYAPPPSNDELQYGFTDLYLMPADGSADPQVFMQRQASQEAFFHPVWAPDGESIFYSHFFAVEPDSEVPQFLYTVEQVDLSGSSRRILENAFWPAISPDGSQISYLTAYPDRFVNELYLATIDGSQPRPALAQPADLSIDAHIYTPDGQGLIFSMVNPPPAPASSFWDRLFGVQIARAHDVPSDWYRVPIQGGEPQRLTNLETTGLAGALSPDGSTLVFIASNGLYSLELSSGEPALLSEEVYIGSIDWIP
jgi:Tol biopolymer transport system component